MGKVIGSNPFMTTNQLIQKLMEDLESKIVELLNEADETLTKDEFETLAESIIDYIDELARSKKWQDKYMPDICNNDEYLMWLKEFGYFTDENYIKKVNDIKEYEEKVNWQWPPGEAKESLDTLKAIKRDKIIGKII